MNNTVSIQADTLVTGGTGFLGRWLVASLSREGRRVVVLARGGVTRAADLHRFVAHHHGDSSLVTVVDGDLSQEGLGIQEDVEGIQDVYHLAAVFAFGMKQAFAREVNVEGTLRVAEWARQQPNLRRVIHLGGYRATIMPLSLQPESFPLSTKDRARLYRSHGGYEASKLEAYFAMKQFAEEHQMPYTAVHPSGVIGSSQDGETSQMTGFGEVVEKLWKGKLPALAGSKLTNLPLVSVDYLADFLCSVPTREETIGQDLCVLDPNTKPLPELIADIADHIGVKAPTRIVSPKLLGYLPKAVSGVERESLSFLTEDEYDTKAAEQHAQAVGLPMPSIATTTSLWVDHLVSTRFGKDEAAPAGGFVCTGDSQSFVTGEVSGAEAILLHGLPWDSESGRALGEAMDESIARPDLPGLGRSSQSEQSDDHWLATLLEDRQEPALLVGHSHSTGVSLRYAAEHPDRVRGLVLISPFFLQARAPWYMRFAPLTKRLLRLGSANVLQGQLIKETQEVHPAVRSAHEHLRRPGVATRVATAIHVASRPEERAELVKTMKSLSIPMLIIHGEDDPLTDSIEPGVGTVAGADVVCISGSGHSPHVDKPTEVAVAIRVWQAAMGTRACTG